MKELETERDEAEARKKELEGELQKARAESAALEEDVGGILRCVRSLSSDLLA